MIMPETMKRAPAIRNGGIVSTANRMPRYVDPQMIYTAANAEAIFNREGEEDITDLTPALLNQNVVE